MHNAVKTALESDALNTKESEIAFFGGSFTAIDKDYMISLLSAAKEYLPFFKGIRISTRPDRIDKNILNILKYYGVTSIELGAQSMSDEVLQKNNRGHNSDCVRKASQLIKENGFSLGLQMMTGLYGSTLKTDMYTATEFVKIAPDTVRIYPTVILENTELANLYKSGLYNSYSLEESVSLCAELIPLFEQNNISVIRVGLHSSDTMESKILAGAYHPAFRELCENKIFLNKIISTLTSSGLPKGKVTVYVAKDAVSKASGQKKKNISDLKALGYDVKISTDEKLCGRHITIQEGY